MFKGHLNGYSFAFETPIQVDEKANSVLGGSHKNEHAS